jgi:hypothetical protein
LTDCYSVTCDWWTTIVWSYPIDYYYIWVPNCCWCYWLIWNLSSENLNCVWEITKTINISCLNLILVVWTLLQLYCCVIQLSNSWSKYSKQRACCLITPDSIINYDWTSIKYRSQPRNTILLLICNWSNIHELSWRIRNLGRENIYWRWGNTVTNQISSFYYKCVLSTWCQASYGFSILCYSTWVYYKWNLWS